MPLATRPSCDRASIRVLVVDDHELLNDSLAYYLGEQPGVVCVGSAADLATATRLAAQTQPDVILLDQHLPDGLGSDHASRLRDVAPHARLLLLTADWSDDLPQALTTHADYAGVMSKDRGLVELRDAIRATHEGGRVVARPNTPAHSGPSGQSSLTKREVEVLRLLAQGRTNNDIAVHLRLTTSTVRNHVQHICTKLGAGSKLHALSIALRRGILQPSHCAENPVAPRQRTP